LYTNAQVNFRCVFVFGLQVCSFSATVVTYTAKYFFARASGLALGWLSVKLTVTLGLRLGIGLGLG